MKLTAFNHTNINVMGQIRLPVKHRDVVKNINFIVTNIDTATIIGRNDAVDLHCVKFLYDNCDQCNDDNMCIKSSSTSFNTDSAKLKWKHALPLGDDPKSKIVDLFPELFKGVGCVDTLYRIELEPDAIPVKHAPRRVPEAIKPKVKDELDRLVHEGIIMPVEVPTDWVNSIVCVTKPNGDLRLCLDPKDLNKFIRHPHHYSPTIDDVLPDLCGSQFFSTLDARSGYWNIPLDNRSSLLTTFNTPGYGRFCFKRLPFGLVSSQDLFQKVMDDTLIGLPNVKPVADDIKIHGKDQLEHDLYLLEVLERCQNAGLHLNPDKCHIRKSSVKFYGTMLTSSGMKADPKKVEDILNLAAPTNKQEVRSLVGMVTFLNRFIDNTSSLLEPIRKLLKSDVHFVWDATHDVAFKHIKSAIANPNNLAYFDVKKETEIQCDASLKGIGVCLLQEGKPVYFASKSLTETESRYSNIEREMLGVVFALTRLHQYSFGRHVTVISDHKPLESLNLKNLNLCPPRLQRMLLRIQEYDYDIGPKIPVPDCLSRLVPSSRGDPDVPGMDIHVNEIVLTHQSKLETIRIHVSRDNTLLTVTDFITEGWPADRSSIPTTVLPYWPYKDELGYYNGIIVKGDRVVIRSSLVNNVLKDIHSGHLGIEKCRLHARASVFWPNMNKDIAQMVNSCEKCQVNAGAQANDYPVNFAKSAHFPMHRIGTDLFDFNGKQFLIMVDYYSSYPWVRRLRNISSASCIDALKSVFSEFGYPQHIHSDSGRQYSSQEFKSFVREFNMKHTMSSPYYHESNGKAECYVGIVKRMLKKCDNIYDALLAYRSTPLCNSRHRPYELLFNRRMKDNVISLPVHYDGDEDESCDKTFKYGIFNPGDKVFIFDKERKFWEKGRILSHTEQPNQYDVLFNTGRIARRNRVHLKNDQTPAHSEPGPQKPLQRNSEPGPQKPPQGNFELGPQKPPQGNFEPVTQKSICELLPPQPEADTFDSSVVEEQALTGPDVIDIPDPHVLRRSSRVDRRKPSRFKDYEL